MNCKTHMTTRPREAIKDVIEFVLKQNDPRGYWLSGFKGRFDSYPYDYPNLDHKDPEEIEGWECCDQLLKLNGDLVKRGLGPKESNNE